MPTPRTLLALYLLFLSVYLLTGAGHFISVNHAVVYQTTQSLVERGNLALKTSLVDTVKGPDGKVYGAISLGQSLLAVPLYVVGRAVDQVSLPELQRYFRGRSRGVFGGETTIFFVSLLNQLITPLTCLLVFLVSLRLGISRRAALVTTLAFGFGTAAWAYSHDFFPHPLESLLLLLSVFILVCDQDHITTRAVLLAGLAMALAVLTRVNLLVLTPVIWLYVMWRAGPGKLTTAPAGFVIQRRTSNPPRAQRATARLVGLSVAYWLPIAVVMGVILYLNAVRFGSPWTFNPLAESYGFDTPLWLGLYGNLLSPGRSIFLYSPPLILALLGWPAFFRARRAEAVLFGSLVGVLLVLYSTYADWHGGWVWGPRYLLACLPFLIVPLGYWATTGWRIALVALAVAFGTAVQVLGMVIDYTAVYADWEKAGFEGDKRYLFIPEISAIPIHFRDLLTGQHIDFRLLEVYRDFGTSALVWTIALPVAIFVFALMLYPSISLSRRRSD